MLCVYGLSKGHNPEMTEYTNLELPGNDKGDDPKSSICRYRCYYNYYATTATKTTTALLYLEY